MRPVLFFIFITFYLLTASPAIANEARETKKVTPNSKVNYLIIPEDPQERAEMLQNLEPGNCCFFMYNTLFTPSNPEQTSLRPGLVLNNQAYPPYRLQGYCIARDSTGLRAEIYGRKIINDQIEDIRTIHAGGNRIYSQVNRPENMQPLEETIDNNYLDYDGKGAYYFLNSIRLRGIIIGPSMENLLEDTDARQIGVENIRGTRTIVYGIQPTKKDFMNGYRYLQVWVRVGDYKLIRTNVDFIYGREFTEYSRHMTDVHFDDSRFLMPGETVVDMQNEYNKMLYPQQNVDSEEQVPVSE